MDLRIAELLEERGIRKAELARRAGLTQSNLNAAINNGNPTLETLERIAMALGVEVHELLTNRIPSRQEGIMFLDGQAYALVKAPYLLLLPSFVNKADLQTEIMSFVSKCVKNRKAASISGLLKGSELFTIIYDPNGETERFYLSVSSGRGDRYTGVYMLDEYQQESDSSIIVWDKKAITMELSHDTEGDNRGERLYNTCEMC